MKKDELKKWFIDKFNSCYAVKHDDYPNSIFFYYDDIIIRKSKLCKLNNTEFRIDKITGNCLFEQNYKNSYLWCDYTKIWSILEKNYSNDYNDIQDFISEILKEQDNFNSLVPHNAIWSFYKQLKEHNKMIVLRPGWVKPSSVWQLNKDRYKIL